MKSILYAATALAAVAAFVAPTPVDAAPISIIQFAQQGTANTVNASASAAGTTIVGLNVPVTITSIDNATSLPITFPNAFLDLNATSTVAGATNVGGAIVEHFNGTFSINSLASNLGTNYLAGSFADAAITSLGSLQIALAAPTASFTSDVITQLGLPTAIGFTFTSVNPPVSLVAAAGTTSGQTLAGFSAAVAGNAAASAVPEPASLAMLGVGLLGLGFLRSRKRHDA